MANDNRRSALVTVRGHSYLVAAVPWVGLGKLVWWIVSLVRESISGLRISSSAPLLARVVGAQLALKQGSAAPPED